MSIEDPFSTPIGVIAINAHGCDSIHFDMVKPITYPINGADIDESLHEATERVEEDKKETATVDFNDGQGAVRYFQLSQIASIVMLCSITFSAG